MQTQLDAKHIRDLAIPFNKVLPPGALKDLKGKFDVSETTPRKVLTGEWTNQELAKSALRIVIAQTDLSVRFLRQFPKELIDKLHAEADQLQTA